MILTARSYALLDSYGPQFRDTPAGDYFRILAPVTRELRGSALNVAFGYPESEKIELMRSIAMLLNTLRP